MESHHAMKEYMEQYHTHPDEMRGAPREKQNAMMHKQVSAFDKLVQHSISKFSKDRLYRMLSEVTPNGVKLASFSALNSLLEKEKLRAKKEKRKEEDSPAVKYFNAFFADIEFLKKIKKHFDQKIVAVLYEYFYENIVAYVKAQKGGARKKGSPKAEDTPLEELKKETDILSRHVEDLRKLSAQWQQLLDDDVIDTDAFDGESSFEISMYNNCDRFHKIFRFIPDLLMKSFNGLESAKKWWIQAEKIHKMLKRTPTPPPPKIKTPPPKEVQKTRDVVKKHPQMASDPIPKAKPREKSTTPRQSQAAAAAAPPPPAAAPPAPRESPRKEKDTSEAKRAAHLAKLAEMGEDMEVKLRALIDAIHQHEVELKLQQTDLKKLLSREERYEALKSDLEKVEEAHVTISRRLGMVEEQKRQLVKKILKLGRSSKQYRETYHRIKETEGSLKGLEQAAVFCSFQQQLLASDLDVEMEVRPSMIRFAGDVQEQVRQIEEWLEEEIREKNLLERELIEIRKKMPRRIKTSSDIGVGTSDLPFSDAGTWTEVDVSLNLNDSSDELENAPSEFDPYAANKPEGKTHQQRKIAPSSKSLQQKNIVSQSSQTSSGYGGGGSRSESERKRSKSSDRSGSNQKRSSPSTNGNATRSSEQSKVSKNSPSHKRSSKSDSKTR